MAVLWLLTVFPYLELCLANRPTPVSPSLRASSETADSLVQSRAPSPAGELQASISKCAPGGHWPSPLGATEEGKPDLLISWYTGAPQSSVKSSSPPLSQTESPSASASLLNASAWIDAWFENQAEVKYQLRSYEKHGLLDHIRNVIILVDAVVLENNGAPRFFNYVGGRVTDTTLNRIRVVTDKDIGVENTDCARCGVWSKYLTMHTIPGLSDYFIYTSDDVFMLKPFDGAAFYDAQSGKPALHGFGTWREGWCDGGQAVGAGHGPVLINKCAYKAVAEHYKQNGFHGGVITESTEKVDALCLYSNAMMSQWTFHGYGSGMAGSVNFFRECHTNGGCELKPETSFPNTMFVNVQGPGLEDTKKSEPHYHRAKEFFHTQFDQPSRFEISNSSMTAPSDIGPTSAAGEVQRRLLFSVILSILLFPSLLFP